LGKFGDDAVILANGERPAIIDQPAKKPAVIAEIPRDRIAGDFMVRCEGVGEFNEMIAQNGLLEHGFNPIG